MTRPGLTSESSPVPNRRWAALPAGSFEEVGGRPGEELAVEGDVDLLVVEGDQAGDGEELAGGEVVGPGQVRVGRVADRDVPVAAGRALVRAGGDGVGGSRWSKSTSVRLR